MLEAILFVLILCALCDVVNALLPNREPKPVRHNSKFNDKLSWDEKMELARRAKARANSGR